MPTRYLLPASAYLPGDRVAAEDGLEKVFGRVSKHHASRHAEKGEVLIFWDNEEYGGGDLGHQVPVDLLELWPERAHEDRLRKEIEAYLSKEPLLDRAVRLARISLAFSRVERVTLHEDGVRLETDSDHTIMLGLIACDVARGLCLDLDLGLLSQFSYVHDLVEVYAGDTQTLSIDAAGRANKAAREEASKNRLREELGSCWIVETLERYERQDCPEAHFVRVLDKVLPKLTHLLNGCAAAKKLTNEAGFKASHEAQAAELLKRYPHVADEIHALLRASMEASEVAWGEGASSRS